MILYVETFNRVNHICHYLPYKVTKQVPRTRTWGLWRDIFWLATQGKIMILGFNWPTLAGVLIHLNVPESHWWPQRDVFGGDKPGVVEWFKTSFLKLFFSVKKRKQWGLNFEESKKIWNENLQNNCNFNRKGGIIIFSLRLIIKWQLYTSNLLCCFFHLH